jgi:hypothetical protein
VYLAREPYHQLVQEAISILLNVKEKIKDNSDCVWTYYENSEQMKNEIDNYVLELTNGSLKSLDEIYTHFLPTAAYQEHSMANNWSPEYHKLASKFDKVYVALKNYS